MRITANNKALRNRGLYYDFIWITLRGRSQHSGDPVSGTSAQQRSRLRDKRSKAASGTCRLRPLA